MVVVIQILETQSCIECEKLKMTRIPCSIKPLQQQHSVKSKQIKCIAGFKIWIGVNVGGMAFHNHGSDAITGTVYSIVHVFNECSIALYDGRDRAELQLTVVINIIYK